MHLLNPFWFRFPKKIETKEEMISFLENNQEELEDFDDAWRVYRECMSIEQNG